MWLAEVESALAGGALGEAIITGQQGVRAECCVGGSGQGTSPRTPCRHRFPWGGHHA